MPALQLKSLHSGKLMATILFISALVLSTPDGMTQDVMYVSDKIEITLRDGPNASSNVVKILKSGDSVTLLEANLATQYSRVESADGSRGYVLSRFLSRELSTRAELTQLQQLNTEKQQTIDQLTAQISGLNAELEKERSDIEALKNTLLASENELDEVRSASENTLNIHEENERLSSIVATLREEKNALSKANESLKDSTQIDWFIRGGVFFLIAFVLGIMVTRIRWKRADSWGSI